MFSIMLGGFFTEILKVDQVILLLKSNLYHFTSRVLVYIGKKFAPQFQKFFRYLIIGQPPSDRCKKIRLLKSNISPNLKIISGYAKVKVCFNIIEYSILPMKPLQWLCNVKVCFNIIKVCLFQIPIFFFSDFLLLTDTFTIITICQRNSKN